MGRVILLLAVVAVAAGTVAAVPDIRRYLKIRSM